MNRCCRCCRSCVIYQSWPCCSCNCCCCCCSLIQLVLCNTHGFCFCFCFFSMLATGYVRLSGEGGVANPLSARVWRNTVRVELSFVHATQFATHAASCRRSRCFPFPLLAAPLRATNRNVWGARIDCVGQRRRRERGMSRAVAGSEREREGETEG